MKARLEHPAGMSRIVKAGYSWTTLFFGILVPLFRGDFKWAILLLILDILLGSISFGIGIGIGNFILGFIYNSIYIKDLMAAGYVPATARDADIISSYMK